MRVCGGFGVGKFVRDTCQRMHGVVVRSRFSRMPKISLCRLDFIGLTWTQTRRRNVTNVYSPQWTLIWKSVKTSVRKCDRWFTPLTPSEHCPLSLRFFRAHSFATLAISLYWSWSPAVAWQADNSRWMENQQKGTKLTDRLVDARIQCNAMEMLKLNEMWVFGVGKECVQKWCSHRGCFQATYAQK